MMPAQNTTDSKYGVPCSKAEHSGYRTRSYNKVLVFGWITGYLAQSRFFRQIRTEWPPQTVGSRLSINIMCLITATEVQPHIARPCVLVLPFKLLEMSFPVLYFSNTEKHIPQSHVASLLTPLQF